MPTLPGDVFSFAGVMLQADVMRIRALDGFTAVPPLRGTGFVRSAVPGEMFRGKIHGARVFGLEIILFSRTFLETGEPDYGPVFANLDRLARVFNTQYQEESELVHYHPDGSIRTALAHVVGFNPKMSEDNTGAVWIGTAEFLLSDPYFYTGPVVTTVPGDGTVVHINNPGTVRTHRIHIDFVPHGGGDSGPSVFRQGGMWTGINAPYSSAAMIDAYTWQAQCDGVNNIGHLEHVGDLPFLVFEPGDNSLTAANCDHATITWYPAWV